jgi:hypothetical protein
VYGFAGSDPVNGWDPTGTCAFLGVPGICEGGAIGFVGGVGAYTIKRLAGDDPFDPVMMLVWGGTFGLTRAMLAIEVPTVAAGWVSVVECDESASQPRRGDRTVWSIVRGGGTAVDSLVLGLCRRDGMGYDRPLLSLLSGASGSTRCYAEGLSRRQSGHFPAVRSKFATPARSLPGGH